MNFAGTTTAPASADDFERMFALFAVIADPAAHKKRLEELATASGEARRLIDDAEKGQVELKAARDSQALTLAAAKRAHDEAMAREIGETRDRHTTQGEQLDAREREIAKKEAMTEVAAKRAVELKADLERRLAIISKAAG